MGQDKDQERRDVSELSGQWWVDDREMSSGLGL